MGPPRRAVRLRRRHRRAVPRVLTPEATIDPTRTQGEGPPPDAGAQRSYPPFIGRYRILGILGQGGMGTVYEAEQDQPRRVVALKVIRAEYASPSLLRRFEQESQLLGTLQHPGIAQIHDAGTEDTGRGPQPYFAMELIRGRSLLEHAADRGLATEEKLALFIRVCEAVQHAHSRGIIHRDLKPGNILVDESGQPKILDFGVARATDSDVKLTTVETNLGQLIGTLPYMSPEQVAADPQKLDTRSDIYALGVILYELLSGERPYVLSDRMLHEAVRVIREDDPKPLSTIDRVFRGDVDTIVGKALEKEPARRYQSAAEMASDIQRYLANEPISARPPSAMYQLGKFARRNRALVAGIAAVFVALVLGVVASTWQAVRATRAERQARSESAKAIAVNQFLQTMLASAQPDESMGRDVTVRDLLDESARSIDAGSMKDQPLIEAAVRSTIGRTYNALGAYETSVPHLEKSLAGFRATPGASPEDVVHVLITLGDSKYRLQDRRAAEAALRESVEVAKREFGETHVTAAKAMQSLGFYLATEQRPDLAEPLYREALAIARATPGHEVLVSSLLAGLGSLLKGRNDLDEAKAALEESLAIRERVTRPDHPDVATALWLLGEMEVHKLELAPAEGHLLRALEIRRKVLGPGHPHTALVLVSLGRLEIERGGFPAAKAYLDEALAIRTKTFGPEHVSVASSLGELVEWHARQGDFAAAAKLGREQLALWKRLRGPDDPEVSRCENLIARWVQRAGDLAGAEELYRDALRIDRKVFGQDSSQVALLLANLAGLLYPKGDVPGATAAANESLAIYRKVLAPGHHDLAFPIRQCSFLLDKSGAYEEALALDREALEITRKHRPADSPENGSILASVGGLLLKLKRWEEAEAPLRESLAIRTKALPADDWRLANLRSMLGESLGEQKKDAEAEPLLVEGGKGMRGNAQAPADLRALAEDRVVRFYRQRGRTREVSRWSAS